MGPSYLYNGNPHTSKTVSSYWDSHLGVSLVWEIALLVFANLFLSSFPCGIQNVWNMPHKNRYKNNVDYSQMFERLWGLFHVFSMILYNSELLLESTLSSLYPQYLSSVDVHKLVVLVARELENEIKPCHQNCKVCNFLLWKWRFSHYRTQLELATYSSDYLAIWLAECRPIQSAVWWRVVLCSS